MRPACVPARPSAACFHSALTSINTIMGKNSDYSNTNVLSSEKGHKRICCGSSPGSSPDPWRDVERLRAALDVERSRNQQARRRFSLELRRQREEARQDRERALRELTYRLQQQKALELLQQKDRLGRERATEVRRLLRWRAQEKQKQTREHHRLPDEVTGICKSGDRGTSTKTFGCKGNEAAYRKLEELLKTLFVQADGQQVALLQRLQQEVNLEKSYFLCHLLEAHSHPAQEGKDQTGCVIKLARPRSKSCMHPLSSVRQQSQDQPESAGKGKLALFRSNSLSQVHSASPEPMKKKKKEEDSETPPLSSSATEEDPCKEDLSGDLPQPSEEESDLQHSSLLETPPPEKCPPSRCSEENMDDTC